MDLPFYYSYKEFTDNNKTDFELWLQDNSGKNEIDYLKWLYSLAGYYVGYREFEDETPKYTLTDMSFGVDGITTEYEIPNYVSIFIGVLESNFKKKFNLCNDNKLVEFIYDFEGELINFVPHDRFYFNNVIYQLLPFFKIEKEIVEARSVYDDNNEPVVDEEGKTLFEEGNFKMGCVVFDYDKYLIFLGEMKLINEFILKKIAPERQKEKESKSNLTTPEKIALLEHLGVFTKLVKDGVSPENEYKIIHNLIGGSYTNIKKYCLNRKTKNKSSKDYQINEKHKNTIRNFYNSKTY
ncbi:hypothetical protein [Chryseobacterium limigenitum]|uniref:Uncharacterized protein n=1 Tax=Chryseobacterium limigenitum TaxID=1612149 RepID=A0A1K2ISS4_9FLAO|nr:hypothetical protein [Chryseobacterium limigenitum]SFZ95485.1 hypothetical protein SAMN05216324_11053 [Chryseobacterium limigenitum]